ncbi:Acyl-CoA synthetase (AMP-forming)/AMP-acid ligase II [Actinopolyspora xinjiangensis]|uniref:Acyl-CoA synthetase (AMP-forming)/AMP-acid ligase II n=1 Tax=Actinopolyspora xinjiangensis TaxID=405564 RepID=A0A1H0WV66_9ACTN|nr:fatty acyl-AMP ligase [Actinopolyspora xinjiangensis]SDP94608.1 Acyl-CoA synthetase (AMP-forming)/AMP-acid ligase II [Actinopolyspora xinjiangensis]
MESTTAEFASQSGGQSLTECLDRSARERPDATAITFVDYEASGDGLARSLTVAELHRRVRAVASWTAHHCGPGERVAILAPQGIDYVVGFLGAIRAGAIAVPLFQPDMPGQRGRLEAVLDDCEPAGVLTTEEVLDRVREVTGRRGGGAPPECLAVDASQRDWLPERLPAPVSADDVAYLQYTSGSTRVPAGVRITHANVVANARQALSAYFGDRVEGGATVSWLPLFHDMGLVLSVAAPVVGGIRSVLMDPTAFLRRPVRWLHQLSANPRCITAAPNFAFDYTAARVTEREKARTRLDRVISMINGSEPVLPSTVERFNRAFEPCGLRPEAHRSSFGLAEATVFVSTTPAGSPPRGVRFDRDSLGKGIAVAAAGNAMSSTLVSCGRPLGQRVAIVDPESHHRLPDTTVGEIWVHGPNTGQGYWNRTGSEEAEAFRARLRGSGELPETGWLRTGDLGVRYDDELFVTGRIKDLIVLDGRNHYPQDLEQTVELHPAVRKHHTAVFAVTVDETERVVVAAEYSRSLPPEQRDSPEISAALRGEIAAAHGVRVHEVLLLEPDTVPRTSSGKVARSACRQYYLDGELGPENTHD